MRTGWGGVDGPAWWKGSQFPGALSLPVLALWGLSLQCGRGSDRHFCGSPAATAATGGRAGGGRVQHCVHASAAPAPHDPDPGEARALGCAA